MDEASESRGRGRLVARRTSDRTRKARMESCSHGHNVIAIQHGCERKVVLGEKTKRTKKKKEKKEGKRLARRRKGWPGGRGKGRQAPRPPETTTDPASISS